MGDWKLFKLKEICTKIGSGATPRGGKSSYKEEGITLIRSQNVLDFKFSEEGLAELIVSFGIVASIFGLIDSNFVKDFGKDVGKESGNALAGVFNKDNNGIRPPF